MAAKEEGQQFLEANGKRPEVTQLPSGLQYEVLRQGSGAKPGATDTVKVNYRGTFIDGTTFDSSYDRGQPSEFPLNRLIAGWSEGLQHMAEGAHYKLFIPYELAYGEAGIGPIPGYSTLIFEVELLEVK